MLRIICLLYYIEYFYMYRHIILYYIVMIISCHITHYLDHVVLCIYSALLLCIYITILYCMIMLLYYVIRLYIIIVLCIIM